MRGDVAIVMERLAGVEPTLALLIKACGSKSGRPNNRAIRILPPWPTNLPVSACLWLSEGLPRPQSRAYEVKEPFLPPHVALAAVAVALAGFTFGDLYEPNERLPRYWNRKGAIRHLPLTIED